MANRGRGRRGGWTGQQPNATGLQSASLHGGYWYCHCYYCTGECCGLARFADDYVVIDMAKVRKFDDGLELSIWGKIVGLLLQDMNLMVKMSMTIEREVDVVRKGFIIGQGFH